MRGSLKGPKWSTLKRYQRPSNAFVLCTLGGLFTLFAGFSFIHYGSYYGSYLGIAALTTGLVTMTGVVMLQVMPQKRELLSAILIGISLSYWAALFVWYGRDWGLIWGLSGPVYTLVGGVLGFLSKPSLDTITAEAAV